MRYRRVYIKGATYFFTLNLLNRHSSLLTDHITHLRKAIVETQKSHPFIIDGIVILPEHVHIVITLPDNDSDFSFRLAKIKSLFSRQIARVELITDSRKNKRERGIWQRRFWEHLIKDEIDFEHHLNYIHYNPVKHGYVKKASDWPYSSIHKLIKKGTLSVNWAWHQDMSSLEFGES